MCRSGWRGVSRKSLVCSEQEESPGTAPLVVYLEGHHSSGAVPGQGQFYLNRENANTARPRLAKRWLLLRNKAIQSGTSQHLTDLARSILLGEERSHTAKPRNAKLQATKRTPHTRYVDLSR